MKRAWFFVFISVYLCLCLLASCAASGGNGGEEPPAEESGESTVVCRVISQQDGTLLLAGTDEGTGLYQLHPEADVLTVDGAAFDPAAPDAYAAFPESSLVGAVASVRYDGGIQESWPMGFSGVTGVDISSTEGFNDLCRLYLQVLEDLWSVDAGLNSDITTVGVDLSCTRLSPGERSAVAYAFGVSHGVTAVEGTWEDLVEQGYITGEPLEGGKGQFYQWEDGCLFAIEESGEPAAVNMPDLGPGETAPGYDAVAFDASKWRSSLGAYMFTDCSAVSNGGGHWDGYTVGAEMIS